MEIDSQIKNKAVCALSRDMGCLYWVNNPPIDTLHKCTCFNVIILAPADTAVVSDALVHDMSALRRGGLGGAQHRWCGMDTQDNEKASGGHLDGDFLNAALNHDYGWSCNHTDCTQRARLLCAVSCVLREQAC